MSTARNDGGAAFPSTSDEYDIDSDRYRIHSYGGMTLRDYFAAEALPLVQRAKHIVGEDFLRPHSYDEVATDAYRLADAMLAAREAA